MSGAGSSGTGRGRGAASLPETAKTDNKEVKPNPKMSKALSTSAKRWVFLFDYYLAYLVVVCVRADFI